MSSFPEPVHTRAESAELAVTGLVAEPGHLRLSFAGDIDMSNAPDFARVIAAHLAAHPHPPVYLDLGGVRFMDSSGVRALLNCHRLARERNRNLYIVGAQPMVRRVLEITGAYDMLTGGPHATSADAG